MKTRIFLTGILLFLMVSTWSQQSKIDSANILILKQDLTSYVHKTDIVLGDTLVSIKAFNLILQKKASYYLIDASEISISRLYAGQSQFSIKII